MPGSQKKRRRFFTELWREAAKTASKYIEFLPIERVETPEQ